MASATVGHWRGACVAAWNLLLIPVSTFASDASGRFGILFPSSENTCGTYVTARDGARAGAHGRENMYANWLTGFITAYNMQTPDNYDVAASTDVPSMMLWLENHCRKHPLESFDDAVNALVIELMPKRQHNAPQQEK